jgi:hypothetical protein
LVGVHGKKLMAYGQPSDQQDLQRNAITAALMNVGNPEPRTQVPQMPQMPMQQPLPMMGGGTPGSAPAPAPAAAPPAPMGQMPPMGAPPQMPMQQQQMPMQQMPMPPQRPY